MGALEHTGQRAGVSGNGHHRLRRHAGAQRGQRPHRVPHQRYRQTGQGVSPLNDPTTSKAVPLY